MRLSDSLILPVAALWQQKVRTLLTILGVMFGAFVLTASLSIGEGVQETINRESSKHDFSRKIDVSMSWKSPESKAKPEVRVEGAMNEARRARLRKSLQDADRSDVPDPVPVRLDGDRLARLAGLPHVARVVPSVHDGGSVLMGPRAEGVSIQSVRPDNEGLSKRIIAGRFIGAPDEPGVVVSEFLAYKLGVASDSDLEQWIGQPLRIEIRGQQAQPGFNILISSARKNDRGRWDKDVYQALDQLSAQLPAALDKLDLSATEVEALRQAIGGGTQAEPAVVVREFPVVGVFRPLDEEEKKTDYDTFGSGSAVLIPYRTALDFYFQEPGRREEGLNHVAVYVDAEKDVKDTMQVIRDLGLDPRASIEFIERERLMYLLIFGGMTCVAGVALLVSALGIANTMLMSVLERTREIGIMKSVGADNRHLQLIFVVEGGLIGLLGGALGLLLAYSASFPGDNWVRSMVSRDMKIDLKEPIFAFPPWIVLAVVGFTLAVTTLAALYPARHAAKVDPVKALRHE